MTKGLYTKLDEVKKFIDHCFTAQGHEHYLTRQMINDRSASYSAKFDKLSKTVESQQRTIEQLTNALQDKYKHGLFVLSEDGKMPLVIRDGEQLLNKRTTWFQIAWVPGEEPTLETEQSVMTFGEEE